MRIRSLVFCMLAACLAGTPALADSGPVLALGLVALPPPPPPPPVIMPDQMQDQQRSLFQQQQEELQRDSREYLLIGKKMPPISQCRGLLRKQWQVTGLVYFLSARVVEADPVFVEGKAAFPKADGKQEVHYYQCFFDKDRTAVVSATIGKKTVR